MDVGVIITFRRQSEAIVGSIESVLSQSQYPDQIIIAGSRQAESTREMAEIYQHEVDEFLVLGGDPGHPRLRHNALSSITTDWVVMLNGEQFLYPDALERFCAGREHSVIVGQHAVYHHREPISGIPKKLPKSILEHLQYGPFPSGTLMVRSEWLKRKEDWFWTDAEGPLFSFVLVESARREGALGFRSGTVLEYRSYREADYCLTEPVWEHFERILNKSNETKSICKLLEIFKGRGISTRSGRVWSRFCSEISEKVSPPEALVEHWTQPPGPVME